jgi:hypothetical protein
MMPAPGGAEAIGRVAFSPDDASPSRARLGRVAAMIADAERATPTSCGRAAHQDAGVVIPLLPRRPRAVLPRPRTGGGVQGVAPRGDLAELGTAASSN